MAERSGSQGFQAKEAILQAFSLHGKRGSRYYNLLAGIFRAGLSQQSNRRGSHFGVVVSVQNCRRFFSFNKKAAQPRFWLVSGPFWSGLGSGVVGLGLWVGSTPVP